MSFLFLCYRKDLVTLKGVSQSPMNEGKASKVGKANKIGLGLCGSLHVSNNLEGKDIMYITSVF